VPGERLGWAFDNETDDLRMDARMIGFDTTALLRDEQVCSPTLSYLFYRTRKLIDGRPIVLAVDEFWQTDRVPSFRDENNDHLKTIRKNEGVVLLATQSARDALNMRHTFLMKRPGGSVLCRFDLSGARDKIAVISARRATHDLMNRLIARHGPAPEAWVPHFEQLAPGIVDQPTAGGGKQEAAA
jgi:type IV secretion system protein VirB4